MRQDKIFCAICYERIFGEDDKKILNLDEKQTEKVNAHLGCLKLREKIRCMFYRRLQLIIKHKDNSYLFKCKGNGKNYKDPEIIKEIIKEYLLDKTETGRQILEILG